MELSVCIEPIGSELPFLERIELVARLGYTAFEFWDWRNKPLAEVAAAAKRHGLAVAAFVGSGGRLVDPQQRGQFIADIREAISVAQMLDCRTLIVTVGKELPGVPRQAQRQSIVEGLRAAAPIAEDAGVTLAVEPLNVLVNHPGYYLVSSAEAFDILREVDSPAVRLLFDIYHQQVSEGNVTANMLNNLSMIAHLHIADVPGRHEPGTGELNYSNILRAVAEAGYKGYAGLEFRPLGPVAEVLTQLRQLIPARK